MGLFAHAGDSVARFPPKKRASKKGAAKEERRGDAYVPEAKAPTRPCPRCGWSTTRAECGYCLDLGRAYADQKARIALAKTLPASYALDEPERLEAEYAARKVPCRIGRCLKCGLVYGDMLHEHEDHDEKGKPVKVLMVFREAHSPSTYAEGLCDGCSTVRELFLQLAQRRALVERTRGSSGPQPGEAF